MATSQTDILLDAGTNELEIMEFIIAGQLFGINVAKVREIMTKAPVKPMQHAHPAIEGIFKPRDAVITVIDLARYLSLPPSDDDERDIFIVANFNNLHFAFHVHSVVGIQRVSWTQIEKPDPIIYGGEEGVATGIAQYQNRLITILDFEKIIAEISPATSIKISDVEHLSTRPRNEKPILIAEDSMLLSRLLIDSLHQSGYSNIIKTDNGQEAWNYLTEAKTAGDEIKNHVVAVVTDIEMPQMDGHRLTKLIKEDSVLKQLPVVLFSSLINDDARHKGQEVGADEQISKPEIANLVSILDRLTADK